MTNGKNLMILAALGVAALFAGPSAAKAGDYCREYTRTVYTGGQPQQTFGIACLAPDGAWRVQSENMARHQNGLYPTAYNNSNGTVIFADSQPQPIVQQITYVQPIPVYRTYYRPVYYRPAPAVYGFNFGSGYSHHRGYDWRHR